jgi:tetratricopeptide (TPR) repeat protein
MERKKCSDGGFESVCALLRHTRWMYIAVCVFTGVRFFCACAQETPWPMKDAVLRVSVRVETAPDHPDLGVFVKIPPGDTLPGKFQITEVFDNKGEPLAHLQIGYHPADGLGVLFAAPKEGSEAQIYIKGASAAPPRPENVNLIPSVFLFTKQGNASLNAAKRLASGYPPARDAFFSEWPCIGSMVNPFGPDDDYSSWYVGCLLLDKPEKIYFATVSDEGSEFAINGKTIHSWPGIHTRHGGAKGQRGEHVDLPAGLHRIDYYHFEARGPQEAQLVWRRKGVTEGDLPELVSGFAKSGMATVHSIQFRDGRAAAVIRGINEPKGYLWLGDQPLTLFSLGCQGLSSSDASLSVAWEFDGNRRLREPACEWLVTGDHDLTAYPVTLAVSNAAGIARTTARLISPWTPDALSLDSAADRLAFRKAFYDMARAVSAGQDPCASWKKDHWGLLVELLEPYRAGPILVEIFTRSFGALQKIKAEERWALEDRFIETLRLGRNDKRMLEWIERLESNERNNARRFRWQDEKVCALLYYMKDLEAARREAAALKEKAIAPDQVQILALRMGDIESAAGNRDAALKFYQEAQASYRSRNKLGMAGGRLAYVAPQRRASGSAKGAKTKSASVTRRVDDWKIYTVHDASMYTTITAYIEQDAVAEAFQKLSDWENESPVSKLGGEYALAEAALYIHVKDMRRAVHTLESYRKTVTMSAQLADAMRLEVECHQRLNDMAAAKEVANDFLKRFPGHPFETKMKEVH